MLQTTHFAHGMVKSHSKCLTIHLFSGISRKLGLILIRFQSNSENCHQAGDAIQLLGMYLELFGKILKSSGVVIILICQIFLKVSLRKGNNVTQIVPVNGQLATRENREKQWKDVVVLNCFPHNVLFWFSGDQKWDISSYFISYFCFSFRFFRTPATLPCIEAKMSRKIFQQSRR